MTGIRRTSDKPSGARGLQFGGRIPSRRRNNLAPFFIQSFFEASRSGYTITSSNKVATKNNTGQDSIVAGPGRSSGKYYLECTAALSSGGNLLAGVAEVGSSTYLGNYSVSLGANSGESYINGLTGATRRRFPPAFTTSCTVSIACDFDAKKLWIGVDGVYTDSGSPAAGTNPNYDSWTTTPTLRPGFRMFASTADVLTLPGSYLYFPAGFEAWG